MRGRFSCVSTSITPATRSASLVSMCVMRPFAIVDATIQPCTSPSVLNSAAVFAAPVPLACASTREVGVPMCSLIASPHLLVGLRLRRAVRRLGQRANDGLARERDLERVVRVTLRIAQQQMGGLRKARLACLLAAQHGLDRCVAPRPMRDAAERE